MSKFLILLSLSSAKAVELSQDFSENPLITFSELISVLHSRGVYVVLAALIIVSFVISAFTNKFSDEKEPDEDERSGKTLSSSLFWSLLLPSPCQKERIKMVKCETEDLKTTLETLKSELDLANRSKEELEVAVAVGKQDTAENIRAMNERELQTNKERLTQIQIIQEEKNGMSREIEQLRQEREEKLSERAFKEQQEIVESLKSARTEVALLKNMMKEMKAERDVAVKIATDMLQKVNGVDQKETERFIEESLNSELIRLREEEEQKYEKERRRTIEEGEDNYTPHCGSNCILHCDISALGDGPLTICNNLNDLIIAVQDTPGSLEATRAESSNSENSSVDEEGDANKKHLVTRSPAFRAFLNSMAPKDLRTPLGRFSPITSGS
ncbi:uncharacterized protein LOC106669565 isoform X2 [Cimex lectularius]|uniref:Uncharacterized protein n=1 Tax=Cimex lectularius TaxID=79782 RepID=A0A8I6RYA1_CIMLE|nr:uncharacterized protein LOC106669565 isoform X2 [Cimex lectularius]